MKIKICKVLNVISYILAALLVVLALFSAYDWFAAQKLIEKENIIDYEFWKVVHTNAKYTLWVSLIGLVFPLISYIANFKDEENIKFKNKAEVLMSIFLIGIMASVALLLSPIEFNFM